MAKLDPDKTHRNITYHKGRSPDSQIDSFESGNNPSRGLTQWYLCCTICLPLRGQRRN